MTGSITFDDACHPIVSIRIVGRVNDAQFDAYLAKMAERLGRPVVYLYDCRDAELLTEAQQARQAAWMMTHRDVIAQSGAAMVFIIDSAAVRFAFWSMLTLHPAPEACTVVGGWDGAVRWAQRYLNFRGQPRVQCALRDPRPARLRRSAAEIWLNTPRMSAAPVKAVQQLYPPLDLIDTRGRTTR